MKKSIATLFVLMLSLACVNEARAGIWYGNRMATRMATGTNGFARFFRSLGRLEYRKDMWILGRPIGREPAQFCPQCGQPIQSGGYYYPAESTQPESQQTEPQQSKPTPAPKEANTQAVPTAPASEIR